MKNISKLFFALTFVVTAIISFGSYAVGNDEAAERFGIVSVIGAAGFGVASAQASGVFGLQWTRTEETLLNHLADPNRSGQRVFDDFSKGRLRFTDRILYRALLIDGLSGTAKILDKTVNAAVGISNVHQGKLEKDETVCIDTILLEYVNSGGAGTDPSNIAGYDSVVTSWLPGIVNGHIHIKQDNNPILTDLPAFVCGSPADSMFAKGAADGYKLKNPFILEPEKLIEVLFEFSQSIAATNTDFMKISLFGVSTRKRGLI